MSGASSPVIAAQPPFWEVHKMVTAYIMIKANTGDADRLKSEIGAIDGVVEVHVVAGDVDLIAKVEVETPGDVKDISAITIQNIEGIETTQTYIAMD
jgi:DNA-binding Lrp family transcriptional regulator